MRKAAVVLAGLVAASLALTSCSADGGDPGGGDSGRADRLTIGLVAPPATFDAAESGWGPRSLYYTAVYDSLLRTTSEGELEPWLATEWEYNDDNTELTMSLREGVTFSDGAVFDADAVVANIERFQGGTSPDRGNLASLEKVEVVDPSTVRFTLSEPDLAFLSYLARSPGLMQSPESFSNPDLATVPVGSGPYVLDVDGTVTGNTYSFVANPDYWAADRVSYDNLTVRVLSDQTAALNAIKAGEVEVMTLANITAKPEVEAAGWTVNTVEQDWGGLFLLDRDGTMTPAIGEVKVRQAINHALDREALLQAVIDGNGTVTAQAFTENGEAFDPALDERYPYDPAKAKALLAEAGYPDGFSLKMPNSVVFGPAALPLIQQQLGDVGITVELTDPGTNIVAEMLAPNYSVFFSYLGLGSDWEYVSSELDPSGTWNPFHSEDPQLAALIDAVRTAPDEGERTAAFRELNSYVVEQAWFAPVYRSQNGIALAPSVSPSARATPGNLIPHVLEFRPAG